MKFICLTGFLLCSILPVVAVDNLRLMEARARAMGGNTATQSLLYNPSLIAMSKRKSVRLEYFNPYGIKELSTYGGSFEYPHPFLSGSVHISSFGYEDYRESLFRLALGKRLSSKWIFGIGIRYTLLQTVLSETNLSCLSADMGATFQPVDKVRIGMSISNFPFFPLGEKLIENEEFKSYSLQIGFEWEVINGLLIAGNMESENAHPVNGSIGAEYECLENFLVRAGVHASPLLPSFGVGYSFSVFVLDAVATYHPLLGVGTGVGLSVRF